MIIACVLFDGEGASIPRASTGVYDVGWVNRLHRGCRRNVPGGEFEFVCLVDRVRDGMDREVVQEPLEFAASWFSLLEPFRLAAERNDRVVVLGLDTVITGPLDLLAGWDGGFGWIRDPYASWQGCNGVVSASPEVSRELWGQYVREAERHRREHTLFGHPSEMVWLRSRAVRKEYLDKLHPGRYLSYKCHLKNGEVPPECSLVYFHGSPKQSDLGHDNQVRMIWESHDSA